MLESLKKFLNQFKEALEKIPAGRRIAIFAAAGIVLTAMVVMIFLAQKQDFQLLYSNLSSEDASAIISKLKDKRIQYKISADGTSIMVSSRDVYEMRLQLAGDRKSTRLN